MKFCVGPKRASQATRRNKGARFFSLPCGLFAIALILAGCASETSLQSADWNGPKMLAQVSVQEIGDTPPTIKLIQTDHYKIYSTIQDRPDFLNKIAQLMEGAFSTYRILAPSVPPTKDPMQCYLFADRNEWAAFTRQHTGPDADIYMQITRGGYTIHDWYVAYYIGDSSTMSVSAHEGWHQFANRHFKGRLPPFLEEGTACMFENVEWNNGLPRWNLSVNPARALSLRKAMDQKELFPLEQLITLHAGQVVGQSGIKIEAFYAQNWAFARYLWEGENGRFRPAFQQIIADTAAGTVYDPTGSHSRSYLPWNPAGVRPMLEHYLGEDLPTIEKGYQEFMRKIAYDEMPKQFELQSSNEFWRGEQTIMKPGVFREDFAWPV